MSSTRCCFNATNKPEKHLQYLCCIMNFYMNADLSIQSPTNLMEQLSVLFHSIRGSLLIQSNFTKLFFTFTS